MKKGILSFVVLGFFAMNMVVCQTTTSLYMPSCAYSSDQAIGRVSSDSSHIISYHYHGTYGEFVWTDITTNICLKFRLQQGTFISDFERIGDTIFFCGYNSSHGIVGYFMESGFASGSGYVFYAMIPEIRFLDKMEAYYDPNTKNPIVAAVGHDNMDSNLSVNTAIFVFEFSGGNVSYNFQDYSYYWYNRIYMDVAVTNNYIVSVGIYDFVNNQIALTVIDKNNTLFYTPYIPVETAGNMNSMNYSIEELKDDEVAISTLLEDAVAPSNFVSPVHVFDAATATFVNSQTVPLLQKSAPYNEMKYFPVYKTLLLMQTNEYPAITTTNTAIYYLDPYKTTAYNALTVYDSNSYYYSLDRFSNNEFLATGELKSLSHSFLIHDILSSPQFQCLEGDYNMISPVNTLSTSSTSVPMQNSSSSTLTSFKPKVIKTAALDRCK
ncbi:MAG: hypothetical protein IJP80_07620 [Bacteroidales bacterium]|nr:hypothetical protein [Bacteroidales bacterium]